jgi:hypothetical protein
MLLILFYTIPLIGIFMLLLIPTTKKWFHMIAECIGYIYIVLLIINKEQVIYWFFITYTSIKLGYYVDWHLFINNYIIEGVYLMEGGEINLEGDPSKKYPHSMIGQKYHPAGEKRGIDDVNSAVITEFVKDDGTKITSRNPKDWGWNIHHDFSNTSYPNSYHCYQMANLLEYHCKVNGHTTVSTVYDPNPFLNYNASEFFNSIAEPHNIPNAPMSSKLPNNLQVRNIFRGKW